MEQSERKRIACKHTRIIEGLIVDLATGEWLGSYTTHTPTPAPYDYPLPSQAANAPATFARYELDPAPYPDVIEVEVEGLPDGVIDLDAQRSKRGPKRKVRVNQYASFFRVANSEHRGWVDDYVYGSCYVVAGDSNDKLNVKPSHVLRTCLLDEISVEVVKRVIRLEGLRTISDQQARRVCQCARLAIGGMELYLERNPTVLQQLQYEVDFAESYYADSADVLQELAGV
ncbi:hypothetical protein [Pseudomonas syringae group genomosp. 7]|uniref:hypothetical protein n=1 Tax=Pseudomonas syringae group genomosp. 7 TaxID=251699 RepID=UPI000EFDB496|nr:hypothetical protein [Pseudomonas syringae group genomosp. 7]RMR07138.1 hypothetical protein ALP93_200013 [Pseudomonas syringae pv. helianthi]